MSRMVSSQLTLLTDETDYSGIEKVYSIWICRNKIPKAMCNTMSIYELTNTYNSRDIDLNEEAYDLMNMVILRLGSPDYESSEDIFKILNALFYPREQKSYEVLKEYVDFSEVLDREVKNMSGLGTSVFYEGVEKGIEQGIEKGIEKGIEQGIEKGAVKERSDLVKKLSKKMDIFQIADATELPIDEIKKILSQ